MPKRHYKSGFTLVEIMIVVAIIGVLATIAIPGFIKSRRRARLTKIVSSLRVFSQAFESYCLEYGQYPPDTHNTLPTGMEEYIDQDDWDADVYGGHYNWEGPTWGENGGYDYAGIALWDTQASLTVLTELDEMIDNGHLGSGKFRLTSNDRYTYIIEE